jgi:hypothetical protein
MKKLQATHIYDIDPSPLNDVPSGYALGQWWENISTGDKFFHKTDGVWIKLLNNSDLPTNTSDLINDGEGVSPFATTDDLANKADLVGGFVPASQLPSYVDDVIEVANFAALPVTGESGKIYLTIDNNKTYRWTGSTYLEISAQLLIPEILDANIGSRLKPADAVSNGYNITKSINGQVGMYIKNSDNTGNGALATINAMGSGTGLYDKGMSFNFANNGYFITYLRNSGFIFSDSPINVVGQTIALRVGTLSTPTTVFTVAATGQINLVTLPTLDNTVITLLGRKADGSLVTLDKSSVSGATDLSYTASPTNGVVVSSTGTDSTIPLADGTNAGLLSPSEKTAITNIPTKTSDLINDGDNGISHFISLEDLPSNLVLYPTSTASDIGGYSKIVTSITDPSYDVTAVDITTGAISGSNQLIASLATSANIIIGNPGLFNVSTIGNIRRTVGSGTAEFYFEVYKRTSGGTETLITTSSNTSAISSAIYSQFSAAALWNDGIFLATDRIILKFYGTKVGGGSDPTYDFQFGGSNPVRTTVPIPLNVVPNINLNDINDVEVSTPLDGQVLQYESATQLWKNKTFALSGYLTVNNPSYTGILSGVGETQTGSSAVGIESLSQTWNTTGTIDGIDLSITNIASNASSTFMRFRISGKNAFKFTAQNATLLFGDGSNNVAIGPALATNGVGSIDGTAMRYLSQPGASTGYGYWFNTIGSRTATSSTSGLINLAETFAPITGTGIYNLLNLVSTINQTGGANGITRGLYINPTLTSAFDYRAIESTQGKVIFADTLTAVGGANAGSLLSLNQTWNTTGAPTAISLNVTNTASGTLARLMDLRTNNAPRFTITKDGFVYFGPNGTTIPSMGVCNPTTGLQTVSTTAVYLGNTVGSAIGYGIYLTNQASINRTTTSGTNGTAMVRETFNPTSGTGTYDILTLGSTINQTGGANGITRGLRINPVLTSAAEFRAIEVEAGKIVFPSTITLTGTTGAQTINKISGKVNAAAGSTSLVVTNNLVTTNSIVMCQLGTNDATCIIKSVVEANGSFTINYIAPTAEAVIKFFVIN